MYAPANVGTASSVQRREEAVTLNSIASGGSLKGWVMSLVLLLMIIAGTTLIATEFLPGDDYFNKVERAYENLWKATTHRQYTEIMRERPWLYIAPATGILFVTGWQLPPRQWARAFLLYLTFGLGFVGGHVFW